MELKQSYIMSIARAKLSLYEQRLLVKCIQSGQPRLQGLPLGRLRQQLDHTYNAVVVDVAMRDICDDNAHYEYVLRAAQDLTKRNFTYLDDHGNWVTFGWVMRAEHRKKTGKVSLMMDKRFFDVLYNMTKGYSSYDLERALSFKLPQTVKLYALLNANRHPITYTIEALKRICGVEDKYKKNNDFVRKIIAPAYEEIKADRCGRGGNYWEYTYYKEGQKIVGITFTPVVRQMTADKDASFGALKAWLPSDYTKLLVLHGGFTTKQLTYHKDLLHDLSVLPHGMDILLHAIQKAREKRPTNMQGYIIGIIKAEVKSADVSKYLKAHR